MKYRILTRVRMFVINTKQGVIATVITFGLLISAIGFFIVDNEEPTPKSISKQRVAKNIEHSSTSSTTQTETTTSILATTSQPHSTPTSSKSSTKDSTTSTGSSTTTTSTPHSPTTPTILGVGLNSYASQNGGVHCEFQLRISGFTYANENHILDKGGTPQEFTNNGVVGSSYYVFVLVDVNTTMQVHVSAVDRVTRAQSENSAPQPLTCSQ